MTQINWHPWATNPLDFVAGHKRCDEKLIAYNGKPVTISRSGGDFVVAIGDQTTITGSNVNTCYLLNINDVRIKT
jgi:hypothetical protein